MPADQEPGNPEDDAAEDDAPRMTLWQRLRYSMVRPDDEPSDRAQADDRSVEEIEEDIRRSNDKERAIGLVVAPVAAVVGLVISSASINYAKTHNQSTAVYDKLTYVLLALALLILLSSMLRKRLFQGITIALFAVAIFQLKFTYVGFAFPFVLIGAWYLIRAYRLQQELKRAAGQRCPAASSRQRPAGRLSAPAQQALHATDLTPRAAVHRPAVSSLLTLPFPEHHRPDHHPRCAGAAAPRRPSPRGRRAGPRGG